MSNSFEVTGGKKLKGEITPQGAKNEALQILCAVLLSPEKITISNIPAIRDVLALIDILQDLGVEVEKLSGPKILGKIEMRVDVKLRILLMLIILLLAAILSLLYLSITEGKYK